MWYRGFLAALLVVALTSVACNEDDVAQIAAGDPVPAGMGTMATAAATAGVAAIATFVSEAAEASPAQKASPANVAIGFFPEQTNLGCADGGSVDISNSTASGFTAQFNNCVDGPYTANVTAVVTNMTTQICNEDGADHEVPAGLTATVNGTVSVSGDDITMTNFGVVISNPQYSTGVGGTCGLEAADLHATGQMSTVIAGQTTAINLGQSSLDFNFQGQEAGINATIDGTLTVDTLCTDGPFPITITTLSTLFIFDGDTTPSSGTIQVNDAVVDFANNPAPPIPCSGFL